MLGFVTAKPQTEKQSQGGDEFWEPASIVSAELKIKRSLFIGHLGLCRNELEARGFLGLVEGEHRNANHNCWAYRLLTSGTEHCSDDGEPSGTAGKPILSVVRQSGMFNLMIVVTRYFGGVKLGVRGLIDAYGQAAGDAAAKAERILRVKSKKVSIKLPYGSIGEITALLETSGTAEAPEWQYGAEAEVLSRVRLSLAPRAASSLDELLAKKIIFSWRWA